MNGKENGNGDFLMKIGGNGSTNCILAHPRSESDFFESPFHLNSSETILTFLLKSICHLHGRVGEDRVGDIGNIASK